VQVLEFAVLAFSLHGPTNTPPVSEDEKVTEPVGAIGAVTETSVTVAVQDVEVAAVTVSGSHETDVVLAATASNTFTLLGRVRVLPLASAPSNR
jgi:hypothetical protein